MGPSSRGHCSALLAFLAVVAGFEPPAPDIPIAGTALEYLDGDRWVATGWSRDFSGQCFCEADTDFEGPAVSSTPNCYKGSQEDCCRQCGATPGCAVGVWSPQGNQCLLRSSADVRVHAPNKTACHAVTSEAPLRIVGRVPGDLVTDLQRAGLVGDPLFGTNFKNASVWGGSRWEYKRLFRGPFTHLWSGLDDEVLLVLDGIKMGTTISLNGKVLGNATNQFVRLTFPVGGLLMPDSENVLTVTFDHNIRTEGRYMQCSGGVDWGPYSDMRGADGLPIWTRGIWKSVALVQVPGPGAAITYLVPTVRYAGGDWPTAPLQDEAALFMADVRTHLWSPGPSTGTLVINGSWGVSETLPVSLVPGDNVFNMSLLAERVKLWWPRGHGAQPMYEVMATYVPEGRPALAVRSARRIGFRLAALVTVNDSDPEVVREAWAQEGNGNVTLMFRINGAPVAVRGANAIPMEALEGRYVRGMHRALVASAADANMNMLRVWGGGIYPFDEFLDACDELGVMVFQDMMYMTVGIMPGASETPSQETELRHQVRRLAHHPSIVLWSGCNECGGSGAGARPGPVYSNFVMAVVAQEDASRVLRNGCPFMGYSAGVHRLSGIPNGKPLEEMVPAPSPPPPPPPPFPPSHACVFRSDVDFDTEGFATLPCADEFQCCGHCRADKRCVVSVQYDQTCYLKASLAKDYQRKGRTACVAQNGTRGPMAQAEPPWGASAEWHGPYQHGGMFPAVNGGQDAPFQPPVVVAVQPGSPIGPTQPGYMVTETGCVVMSSFESMSATLAPEDWSLHSPPMQQRNYPCDPIIFSYFGTHYNLSETGEGPFKKHLYLCMLGQALQRKADVESWRSANIWAVLQWQLNEIWPTGGWGSLEYGTPVQGQVLGGRWKPLQHFLRRSAYADVVAACGVARLATGDAQIESASGPALCYLRNDLSRPFAGEVAVVLTHFQTGAQVTVAAGPAELPAGAGSLGFFCALGRLNITTGAPHCADFADVFRVTGCADGSECIMTVTVSWADGTVAAENTLPLAAPKAFILPKANVSARVAEEAGRLFVDVASDATALYVWLSTSAQGRFSDNGLMLLPGRAVRVEFLPVLPGGTVGAAELRGSLRLEHLGEHLGAPQVGAPSALTDDLRVRSMAGVAVPDVIPARSVVWM